MRSTNNKKPELEASTRRPSWRTACGNRGSTARMRFCNATCASSASVPGANVAVIVAAPEVSALLSKYSRFGMPEISRSIGATTLSFNVAGVAPG